MMIKSRASLEVLSSASTTVSLDELPTRQLQTLALPLCCQGHFTLHGAAPPADADVPWNMEI